jgi:hypothetical protein
MSKLCVQGVMVSRVTVPSERPRAGLAAGTVGLTRLRLPQEQCLEELGAVRQALQTDLETSIRRIADLQAALEEVASSDSDMER